MKVNMTPNPLDVVTIHASQGDTEAREWKFELHNNGELIDTSEVSEQMFFKAYKGGTEQILPENGSVPTTAPFLGDIKYPQGILSDQEFLYRESPTEEDGNAKITSIKGNTLVWNQLVQNGNFASASGWNTVGSQTVSNNVLQRTFDTTELMANTLSRATPTFRVGHKVLVMCDLLSTFENRTRVRYPFVSSEKSLPANVWTRVSFISTIETEASVIGIQTNKANGSVSYKNFVAFDLTQMGLDITEPSEFTSLFPLPYYSYNQGSLLSFMGNGIKTVGKNQFDKNTAQSSKTINASGQVINGGHYVSAYIPILPNTNYYLSNIVPAREGRSGFTYDGSLNPISVITISGFSSATSGNFTTPSNARYMILSTDIPDICQLEFGTSATSYEPYTSSTLSLPISTYFPTGMKSARSVYDELLPTKAITRIGAVDLGSLDWTYASDTGHLRFVCEVLSDAKKPSSGNTYANILCSRYNTCTESQVYGNTAQGICLTTTGRLMAYDSSYTDASTFKSAMSGVYLYYELATPTETPFTTASLVTENAEIPLSNEDGTLICKCTEQLSENPGFIDAKIKLTDSDGECYSNKIQLHVERSPQ